MQWRKKLPWIGPLLVYCIIISLIQFYYHYHRHRMRAIFQKIQSDFNASNQNHQYQNAKKCWVNSIFSQSKINWWLIDCFILHSVQRSHPNHIFALSNFTSAINTVWASAINVLNHFQRIFTVIKQCVFLIHFHPLSVYIQLNVSKKNLT